MTVEVRLKEIRKERGISQNELARRLEMSLANIQKIEYGKAKSIPLDTLDKLCQILECEVGELLVRVPDSDDGSSKKEQKTFEVIDPAKKSKSNEFDSKDILTISRVIAA